MESLRYGSRGNDVLLLQLALKREGSFRGELDGVFGAKTLNAVRRFQSAEGLKPDGIAGEKTLAEAEKYLLGYIRHRLRQGDTFYRLGRKYGVSAQSIACANPRLDPAELPIGEMVTVPLDFPVVPVDLPYSSRLLSYIVRGLTERYPAITAREIGASVLGKPITALKFGRGKKQVLFNAAHHANEWITAPLVLDFLESLAKAHAERGTVAGRSAAQIHDSVTLYVLPMVDPDGVDLVNGAVSAAGYAQARDIAENYPEIPFPAGWKANIAGTDINLNYPAGWEEARSIKFAQGFTGPAPRDYVGKSPLSAPESRALYDFTRERDIALTISYHTQGGEIYWRYKDVEPEGAEEIGRAMAEASGYALADVPEESANAGYRDWFIEEYRRPGFTVEAGRGVNPLPLLQYDRLRQDNFPLMVTALVRA